MIDAAMIEAARRWLMYACLAGLAAFVLIVFCSAVLPSLCEALRRMRAKSRAASAAFAAAAVAAILYAVTKPPTVTVTLTSPARPIPARRLARSMIPPESSDSRRKTRSFPPVSASISSDRVRCAMPRYSKVIAPARRQEIKSVARNARRYRRNPV